MVLEALITPMAVEGVVVVVVVADVVAVGVFEER